MAHFIKLCFAAVLIHGCSLAQPDSVISEVFGIDRTDCQVPGPVGRFNPSTDLLLTHFDVHPDVDDIHSVAAVGSILLHPSLSCVRFWGVAGATGAQDWGKFVPAPSLFDAVYGANWSDANEDREKAISTVVEVMKSTLVAGGVVWITEGGEADFTAEALTQLSELAPDIDLKAGVNIVQHSRINERNSTAELLNVTKRMATYTSIEDGNKLDNGTPGFRTNDPTDWERLTGDDVHSVIWGEAKRIADFYNDRSVYRNPAIAAGGFDFSDSAAVAYVFGYEDIRDVTEFFDTFLVE